MGYFDLVNQPLNEFGEELTSNFIDPAKDLRQIL